MHVKQSKAKKGPMNVVRKKRIRKKGKNEKARIKKGSGV